MARNRIIINGIKKLYLDNAISYTQVVELATGNSILDKDIDFVISFSKGHFKQSNGKMVKGDVVRVVQGMIFDITEIRQT